jgi:hypothetical protein
MLTCHACIKRCLQTLIGDYASVSTLPRAVVSTNRPRQTYGRHYTTVQRSETDSTRGYTSESKTSVPVPKVNFTAKKGTDSTSFNRQKWLDSRGVTPMHKQTEQKRDDPLVRKQLKHLKDPLKLAEHVRATLREDDFESAQAIVRAASKDTQCIVSWNHLIDWQLSKEKLNGAIKTYNEVLTYPSF